MSVFDDVFDDNYPSQILVDEVFGAEHNAGLFDEISVLHQAIMDQNWAKADAQIKHIESLMESASESKRKPSDCKPSNPRLTKPSVIEKIEDTIEYYERSIDPNWS